MNNRQNIELLAPAGSYEALTSALRAGADAVYVGGSRFGARAYANNLDEEMMCRAIDAVHLQDKKIYMTVNTLLKEDELKYELYNYLKPYDACGLDAVIVQDYGVFRFIRSWFPNLAIHASTQMTITGPLGSALLEKEGATRVVTARELSLDDIAAIRATTNLEIESFVHGALCYCYSGQCLFSSMIGGRSGNRGRCAQPCRQAYEVYEQGRKLNDRAHAYPMNTKDMCTIELLPQIIEAGVTSLKIEGRMKKPEYTAGVVSIYRKYLDQVLAGKKNFYVEKADIQTLYDLFHRDGFHQSYYQVKRGKEMMALQNQKNDTAKKDLISLKRKEQVYDKMAKQYVHAKKQEKINGSLSLYSHMPATLTVYRGELTATVSADIVEKAQKAPITRAAVEKQLRKTGETPYEFETLDVFMEDDIFVPLRALNELRREALDVLTAETLKKYRREACATYDSACAAATEPGEEQKKKREQSTQKLQPIQNMHQPTCMASVETKEQVDAILACSWMDGVYIGYDIYENHSKKHWVDQMRQAVEAVHTAGKKAWIAMPYVWKKEESRDHSDFIRMCEETQVDGYLVRNLESLCFLDTFGLSDKVRLDYSMYTWNQEAINFWQAHGVDKNTCPYELNAKELGNRDNRLSELLIYGRVPMMISTQCLKDNLETCTKSHARLLMRDRMRAEFPVQCCCNLCYNVIYNSVPVSLLSEFPYVQQLGCESYRLAFTTEKHAEVEAVCEQTKLALQGEKASVSWPVTRGHFRRSVE